jgi:hypothetical protein
LDIFRKFNLIKNRTMNKPVYKKSWFLSSVIVVAIAIIAAITMRSKESGTKSEDSNLNEISSADNAAFNEFYKKEAAKPCINPPLQGVSIPYTIYKVMAQNGATLDFKTGSKIIIPKNAFVDENGKLLKGEVELRYREFHDAVDFFVSGIPMTYDSAGVKYQFESAGMVELVGYQNGKLVNVDKQKPIHIELASNYKGIEYNLYQLDTLKNNWSCLGKDRVVAKNEVAKTAIKPAVSENKIEQSSVYKTIETKKIETQAEKEIKIAALPKLIAEPKKPEQSKKDKFTFNLDVNPKEFPELAIYKGVLFEVGSENKNFTKEMYDITWDEATIKEGIKKGENYLLTLKKASKHYELIVYPVFEGKNYEVAMKDFQDKFTKYTVVLEKRNAEEKRIEEAYQTKLLALKKQQEELELKWKQREANQFKQMSTDEKVMRMFAVNSFGVYNCDKPSVFPKGVLCSANLMNEKNTKLMCYDVFLVDRAKNGLFTYVKNPITKFSFDPQSTNLLWTVENGVLYWLKPEQFSDMKTSDEITNLKMNRVDFQFKTADEIKTFFNL